MLVSVLILIVLRHIIYRWKQIDEHLLTQVQSCKSKAFTATDGLISQSFVVAFVQPTYVQIALIYGFTVQLSL